MDKLKLLQCCLKKNIFLNQLEKKSLLKGLSIKEILENIDKNLLIKFCFFNSAEIKDLLFKEIEFINLNHENQVDNLENYFYLYKLITNDSNYMNYKYNIEFINNINENNKNEKEKIKQINVSLIILALIKNFREIEEIDLSDLQVADKIEKENKDIISENSNILKDYIDYKKIDSSLDIEKIYNNIIINLIKNKKFVRHNYVSKILNQLVLENINLGEEVINYIIKNSNEEYIKNYIIKNENDFQNKEIINFNYLLLKYIIKNSIDIYKIPFLIETRKFIMKNIFNIYNITIPKLERKIDYIIKIITDCDYYYKNYLKKKKEMILSEYCVQSEIIKNNIYYLYNILNYSSFIISVRENIIDYQIQNLNYDFKVTFEELDKIKENLQKKKELNLSLFQDFIKLMKFLNKIKNILSDLYKNKKKEFEIIMEFSKKIYNLEVNKVIEEEHNLKCVYTFFSKKKKRKLTFRDDRVLNIDINEYYPGLCFLLSLLNDEFNNN